MVNMEEILQKAINDFPIGTEFISVHGNKDIIKEIPYIDSYYIVVNCKYERGRIIYQNEDWATIISTPETIINNFEIW